jgi:hypothetical protein
MPFNTLSPQAQEGLNYAASTILTPGTDKPKFASGIAYADFLAEQEGLAQYARLIADKRTARVAVLETAKYATLAAQVDAAVAAEQPSGGGKG